MVSDIASFALICTSENVLIIFSVFHLSWLLCTMLLSRHIWSFSNAEIISQVCFWWWCCHNCNSGWSMFCTKIISPFFVFAATCGHVTPVTEELNLKMSGFRLQVSNPPSTLYKDPYIKCELLSRWNVYSSEEILAINPWCIQRRSPLQSLTTARQYCTNISVAPALTHGECSLKLSQYHPGSIPSAEWTSPHRWNMLRRGCCKVDVGPACSCAILASLHQNLMGEFDLTWWDLTTTGWESYSCCPNVALLLWEEREVPLFSA